MPLNKENFYLGAVSLGYLCPAKNFWKNVKFTEKQGGPVAKTPSSQYKWPGLHPGQRTRSHALQLRPGATIYIKEGRKEICVNKKVERV